MEILKSLLGLLSLYFIVACFIPKKALFFISDEENRKRWIPIVAFLILTAIVGNINDNTPEAIAEKTASEKKKKENTVGSPEWYQIRIDAARKDSVRFSGLKTDTVNIEGMNFETLLAFATVHKNYSKPDSIELQNETLANLYNYNQSQCNRIFKNCELKLRKRFTKVFGDKVWQDDIEVKATGKNNDILWLTGAKFAANRNIKEAYESLYDMLVLLNFKRVCFKWIEHTDKYTYYDIK